MRLISGNPAHPIPRSRAWCLAAAAGVPPGLTLSQAYEALGLPEGTPYEEVLAAKNRLLEKNAENFEKRMEVGRQPIVHSAGCSGCWL